MENLISEMEWLQGQIAKSIWQSFLENIDFTVVNLTAYQQYILDLLDEEVQNAEDLHEPSVFFEPSQFDHPIERILVGLGLAYLLSPQSLDLFAQSESLLGVTCAAYGAYKKPYSNRFVPTIETAIFVFSADDASKRIECVKQLHPSSIFWQKNILIQQSNLPIDEPVKLTDEALSKFIYQKSYQPQYNESFPATILTTDKTWDDLFLNEREGEMVAQARQWVKNYDNVRNIVGDKAMKGYRVLLYGPPGTGKTLTLALLGKATGKPLYRINISNIVDKYVGETSKKLEMLFLQAANKDWVLFFDEADALFGKRTSTSSAQDRYANQEVSYLLYKFEEYEGMIFLSTNKGVDLDEAFSRRFDTQIRYSDPDEFTRRRLWEHLFINRNIFELDPSIKVSELAEKIQVTGAWIEKFRNYCVLQTVSRGNNSLSAADFRQYLSTQLSTHGGSVRGNVRDLFRKQR